MIGNFLRSRSLSKELSYSPAASLASPPFEEDRLETDATATSTSSGQAHPRNAPDPLS